MQPKNQLERIYIAMRGPEHYPELFRQLRESDLVFLIPYHPEMEGTIGLQNGDRLPPFAVWKSPKKDERIPIFTSMSRAHKACKNTNAGNKTYTLCEINGRQLFELLACQERPIVLNPATDLQLIYLDLRAVKKLADGSILHSEEPGETQQGTVRIVDPADYPTDFIQPLFQFLRLHKEVQAAWLFKQTDVPDSVRPCYVMALKVTGNFESIAQDFRVVASNTPDQTIEYGVIPVDETNPKMVEITKKFPAFYAAPGYQAPSPLGE